MLTCDEALELISASLDGPLAPDESRRLEEHLKLCAPCWALRADLESLHDQLPLLNAPVPEGLSRRILEQVHTEPKAVLLPRRHGLPRRWRQWAASAAAFALVLLGAGGIGLSQITAPPGESALSASSPKVRTDLSASGAPAPDASAPLPSPASSSPVPEDIPENLPSICAGVPDGSAPFALPSAEQDSPPADIPAPAAPEDAEAGSTSTGAKALPQSDSGSSGAPFSYGTQPAAEAPGTSQETIQEALLRIYEEKLGGQTAFTRSALPDSEVTGLLLQPIPVSEDPSPQCAALVYVGTAADELEFHLHSYASEEPVLSARDSSYLRYFVLPATGAVRVETVSETQALEEEPAVHALCGRIDN